MPENERVADILGEWYEQRAQGEALAPEEVIRANPDLADALQAQFESLEVMNQLFTGNSGTAPGASAVVGDFRLVREIGRGGMGVVYEAEQISMGRRVALKILSPSVTSDRQPIERFRREARAAGRIHHTNIVPVHAMGRHGVHWYYAMELVEGRPLRDVIAEVRSDRDARSHGSGSSSSGSGNGRRHAQFVELARMFAGVAEALEASHEEGIIHRDIKPSNLLLDEDGTLKIVDFGLARLEGDGASMTGTGHLVGTPLYMSPEQARAMGIRIDHRTDIYSLGATLYEALALKPPFEGDSIDEICSQITSREPERPSRIDRRVPRDLETIVQKAMEKNRDKRYATAGEMAQDLRRFAEGMPIRARRIGPLGRTWRRVRRNPVRAGLVAAVVVLAVGGGLLGLVAHGKSRQIAEAARARREFEYARLCGEADQAVPTSMSMLGDCEYTEGMHPGETARDLFARAIRLMPDRPEAYFGRSLAPGRTREQRLADLDAARERGLSERTWRAACAEYRRQPIPSVSTAVPEDADPADAYFEARLRELASGQRARTLTLLDRAVAGSSRSSAVRYLALRRRSVAREHTGDLAGALDDARAIRTLGDVSLRAAVRIASLWRRLGNQGVAEQRFAETLDKARRMDIASAWAGLCHACLEQDEESWLKRSMAEAARHHAESPELLSLRAGRLAREGRLEDALAVARRVEAHDPHSHKPLCALGRALSETGRYEEALLVLTKAQKLDPSCPGTRMQCGIALAHLGRPDEAFAAYERARELDPANPIRHNNAGFRLQDLGRPGKALEALDRAIELDPEQPAAHYNRGRTLGTLGRHEEAVDAYDRAIALDPEYVDAHSNRGAVLCDHLRRYEEALAAFDRALEIDPKDALGHQNRGAALFRLGRHVDALAAYDRALELDSDYAQAHTHRGLVLHELGRLEDALEAHDRAIELDPDCPRAHVSRGTILRILGRHGEALEATDRALELDPHDARAYACRGAALRELRRLVEALGACDRSIEIDPGNVVAHSERGIVLYQLGRPRDAAKACARAIDLAPSDSLIRNNLGLCLADLNRHDEALAAYDRAIDLNPDLFEPHINRGRLLLSNHFRRYEDALQALRRALELDPASVRAHVALGVAMAASGKLQEALVAFDRAIELDPDHADAHHCRGRALVEFGHLEEALAAYDRAIQINPENARSHGGRGVTLARLGRPEEALAAHDRAIEIDPAYAMAHYNRGSVLLRLGRLEEALAAFHRAIEIDPAGAEAHLGCGRVHEKSGRLEEALAAYDHAIELGPALAGVHNSRGFILHLLGRLKEALAAFDRAVELDPACAMAHRNRGHILCRLNRAKQAVAAYDRALGIDPADAAIHNDRGVQLGRLGRTEEALAAYLRALKLEPRDGRIHLNCAAALITLRRLEEALEACDRALEFHPSLGKAHFKRGFVLLKLSRTKEALAALDRAVALEPGNACQHRYRGDALEALGNHAEALRAYERSVALRADTHHVGGLVWFLAHCPNHRFRDLRRAVELARKGADLAPESGSAARNLGIALCRNRDWMAGRTALEQAMRLDGGDSGYTRFFLALAHGHLGEQKKAREWFDKAAAWMKEHDPDGEELKRLRGEAAELLGIED